MKVTTSWKGTTTNPLLKRNQRRVEVNVAPQRDGGRDGPVSQEEGDNGVLGFPDDHHARDSVTDGGDDLGRHVKMVCDPDGMPLSGFEREDGERVRGARIPFDNEFRAALEGKIG